MRILVIATYLPPYIGSGNIRILNYINYLNRLGNSIDVVGVKYPKDAMAYDTSLENVFDNGINIYRVNPGRLYRIFNKKKNHSDEIKKNRSTLINRLKSKLNHFIKTMILIPDAFIFWIKPAYKKACELIANNKYDIIFTIHETPSSHIVGYKIKRKFENIRWVGYWSDPWNGDKALRENGNFIKKRIEEFIERKIVNRIDKLLFTTQLTRQYYIDKYNIKEDITDIVYRGYSPEQYEKIRKTEFKLKYLIQNKINIVHTGTIYKDLRDIVPLYNSLARLKDEYNDIYQKINIVFIGQFTDDSDEKKLKKLDCVTIVPLLPFDEAIKYVVNSDLLLLYGNKNSIQVPGKLYEYIGSEAPIITILGHEKDELKYIMGSIDKGPIINNTTNDIFNILSNICNLNVSKWKKASIKFTWKNVVEDLEKKLL